MKRYNIGEPKKSEISGEPTVIRCEDREEGMVLYRHGDYGYECEIEVDGGHGICIAKDEGVSIALLLLKRFEPVLFALISGLTENTGL